MFEKETIAVQLTDPMFYDIGTITEFKTNSYCMRRCCSVKLKDLPHRIVRPCVKCPYTLGLVHTVVNPCPLFQENGYQTYQRFQNKMSKGETDKVR